MVKPNSKDCYMDAVQRGICHITRLPALAIVLFSDSPREQKEGLVF